MIRLHHVQVSCPPGGEEAVRRFYGSGLGLVEVDKPGGLKAWGGAWFRAYAEQGAVVAELHVGVEEPFVAARKAHPAFVVDDLEATAAALAAVGAAVDWTERHSFAGYQRCHALDPHGNRIEVLEPLDA